MGPKNEFDIAVVNEPSVFEPLKFYCIYIITVVTWSKASYHVEWIDYHTRCWASSVMQDLEMSTRCDTMYQIK